MEVAAIPWLLIERHADDAVVHCATHCRAEEVLAARKKCRSVHRHEKLGR